MSRHAAMHRSPWEDGLREHGFRPTKQGAGYEAGGSSFRIRGGWGALELPPADQDPLRGIVGKPGLWKCRLDSLGRVRQAFDLPPAILGATHNARPHGDTGDARRDGFRHCVRWALATAAGNPPEGWSAPDADELCGGIDAELLTLQVGSVLRQIELTRAPGRLGINASIVDALPELDATRTGWLRALLIDAQNRWPMVRIGLVERRAVGVETVRAEVDLSGAPFDLVEQLLELGVDLLRSLIHWIVLPVEFLAAGTPCRALEFATNRWATPA